MEPRVSLLQGTLDMLVLKAVSLGPLHGYGVLLRLEQITGGALLVEQGALYPALFRLEQQELLAVEWAYRITTVEQSSTGSHERPAPVDRRDGRLEADRQRDGLGAQRAAGRGVAAC